MIRATLADRAKVEAFLNRHAPYAMFPLANLANHGMKGGHKHAVTFWYAEKGGQISDVLTVTDSGTVMPFLPSGDYAAAASVLHGQTAIGMIGPRDQTRALQSTLGLADAPAPLDHDEPHYALNLANLTIPDGPGALFPLQTALADTIQKWMIDYDVEALNSTPEDAATRIPAEYAGRIAADSHRVLMDGDTPLAKTGFNAQLPDIVQIGGVYTPPALRGRQHVRRAVALHLAQARANGVTRATLFSASDMANRAYQSLGFERIGDWTLLFFKEPQAVG